MMWMKSIWRVYQLLLLWSCCSPRLKLSFYLLLVGKRSWKKVWVSISHWHYLWQYFVLLCLCLQLVPVFRLPLFVTSLQFTNSTGKGILTSSGSSVLTIPEGPISERASHVSISRFLHAMWNSGFVARSTKTLPEDHFVDKAAYL